MYFLQDLVFLNEILNLYIRLCCVVLGFGIYSCVVIVCHVCSIAMGGGCRVLKSSGLQKESSTKLFQYYNNTVLIKANCNNNILPP